MKKTWQALSLLSATLFLLSGCGTVPVPKAKKTTPSKTKTVLPYGAKHASSILPGDILIADSGNSRLLLVTPGKKIVWQFPGKHGVNKAFSYPDDAFFTSNYKEIITNEEFNGTISIINIAKKKIVWQYGIPGKNGSGPGQLNFPDDAFYYPKTGIVTVADIRNQRILFINRKNKKIIKQYGKTGVYAANPPTTFAAPNGDFPAPHGGMLVTEIGGGHLILLNKQGKMQWDLTLPGIKYPSDANFTPHGNIIVADYTKPGKIMKISPKGKVLWLYNVKSGPGALSQPSLATELPNGLVLVNDDANDRVIVINPKTNKIVWQYGHTGVPGSKPGYLHRPDGTDFLPQGTPFKP